MFGGNRGSERIGRDRDRDRDRNRDREQSLEEQVENLFGSGGALPWLEVAGRGAQGDLEGDSRSEASLFLAMANAASQRSGGNSFATEERVQRLLNHQFGSTFGGGHHGGRPTSSRDTRDPFNSDASGLFAPRRRSTKSKSTAAPGMTTGTGFGAFGSSSRSTNETLYFECLLNGLKDINSINAGINGNEYSPDNLDDEINTIMTSSVTDKNDDNGSNENINNNNNSDFSDKDSPWMQYVRQKIVHGGVQDNRSAFAQRYIANRSKFVRRKLENTLEKTVHIISTRGNDTSSDQLNNNKETTTLMAEKKKNETDDKNGGRPLTLWAAKSLIPLLAAPSLEHHRWIEAVVPLLDVLNQLPPLSLRDENMEMIESLQDALLQPHNVAKDADSERRRIATSTALATALQHGALGPILGVVQTLLESAQTQNKNGNEDAGNTAMFSIDSGRHMHYLRQIKTEYAIPSLNNKVQVKEQRSDNNGTIDTIGFDKPKQFGIGRSMFSTKSIGTCTIAICNGYLYVYLWKKGLFKIGTGVEGTIKGYLYQANVDFNPIKSYLDLKFHNSGGASSGNTTPEKNVANTGNKKSVGGSSSAGKKNKKMKNSSTSSLTPTKLTTPPSNNNNNATNTSPISSDKPPTQKKKKKKQKSDSKKSTSKYSPMRTPASGFSDPFYTASKADGFLYTWLDKLYVYTQKGLHDNSRSSKVTNNANTICLGQEIATESLKLKNEKGVAHLSARVTFKSEIIYTAIYTTKTHIFALRATTNSSRRNGSGSKKKLNVSKGKRRKQRSEKKSTTTLSDTSSNSSTEGNNNKKIVDWSDARNGRPYVFDAFVAASSNNKMPLKYSHTVTLQGSCKKQIEKEWVQQKDIWKSNEKIIAFFATDTVDGPLICASIPFEIPTSGSNSGTMSMSKSISKSTSSRPSSSSSGTSVNKSKTGMTSIFFNSISGQRQEYKPNVSNVVTASGANTTGKQKDKGNGFRNNNEDVRLSTNHVCIDAKNKYLYYIQSGKNLPKNDFGIFVHLLPIFTDAVYEKASDETIQKVTKDLQGHVLPPKETAMVILQELHRIASIELYSKEYYTEKFFSESVYCDFHKTYVTRMVGLLTFLDLLLKASLMNE